MFEDVTHDLVIVPSKQQKQLETLATSGIVFEKTRLPATTTQRCRDVDP